MLCRFVFTRLPCPGSVLVGREQREGSTRVTRNAEIFAMHDAHVQVAVIALVGVRTCFFFFKCEEFDTRCG